MLKFLVLFVAVLVAACSANVASAKESMTFAIEPQTERTAFSRIVVHGGRWSIYATGEIDAGAADRLRAFAAAESIDWAIVYFDSPGGSLIGGINLGQTIRELMFDTGVGRLGDKKHEYKGVCASACAYAFAGGLHRFYSGGNERLGIHQFYADGDNVGDLGDAQLISGLVVAYLQKMGVNVSAFTVASRARSDDMVWLSKEDALVLGLADDGVAPPTAEIKLTGQKPYLKLEQSFSDVTSRVLLSCEGGRIGMSSGIVTTPELSAMKLESVTRSYLEFDDVELLIENGSKGAKVAGSVLWVNRMLSSTHLSRLLATRTVGIWTENGGALRWGAWINLGPVQDQVREFAKNCSSTSSQTTRR